VLYVDDEPQLPAQVDEVLAQVGYELIHTADPEAALRIVREQPPPALVLTEVLLPDCDGFALIERIACAQAAASLPIVVVTRGERTPQLYGRALELGVKDFLCKPVLRTQILEAVLAFARTEPAAPQQGPAQAEATQAPRSIAGELKDQPLPELLARLFRRGASGVLTLRRGAELRAVELRNGSPVELARHRKLEPIADYLLQTRRIDAEQYEMLVDQLMARIAGPREILLGMKALSEAQLASATHEQARGALLEMFRWPSGQYAFHAGKQLQVADTLELDCSPTEIVLAGVQRSPDEVIRHALEERSELYVSLSPTAAERLDDARLTPEQRSAAESLIGESTLAEVLAASTLDPRTLYTLFTIGAVQLDEYPVLLLDQELKPYEPEETDPVAEPEQSFAAEESPRQAPAAPAASAAPEPGAAESILGEIAKRFDAHDDFELFEIDETTRDADVRAAYNVLLDGLRLDRIPPECEELRARARKLRAHLERAYERVRSDDMRRAFAAIRKKKSADRKEEERGSRAVEAESWFRKGESFLARDLLGQAVEAFGMSVHLDPQQGEYAAHLGYALYRSNPRSPVIRREALEHVAKGVKLAPDREKPLLFLGRIFREIGDAAMAEKILRRALKINPDSPALVQELCLIDANDSRSRGKGLIGRLRGR
jgi:CheY-like chemotaxis protein/tetratricopeptide (TPR) repeat protein